VDQQSEGDEGAQPAPSSPQTQPLPPGQPGQVVTVQQTVQGFTGPIPPPAVLAGYEAVLPGLADRLVTMAEQQSAHRQELERQVVNANIRHAEIGLWLGAAVAALLIIAAVLVTLAGYPETGAVIAAVDIVGVVTVFVLRQRAQNRELQNKANQP
jgi:uncharacterized membrane protein